MLSKRKHYALFILIRPGSTGWAAISREKKLQPLISKKKRTLSLEFWSSLIVSAKKWPCQISRVRQTLLTDLAVTEVIFFASKTPIQKKINVEDAAKLFFTFTFENYTNENKMPMARDAENLLQLSPKVLFQWRAKRSSQRAARLSFVLHPCRQYFVPVDRSCIDVKI